MLEQKTRIVTHNSGFHADDVFAVATLLLYLEKEVHEVDIFRTRDDEIIARGDYVVDVGFVYDPEKKRFDHHQKEDIGTHPSGIPYASFGLVWKAYGEVVCGSIAVATQIEHHLVTPIDAGDVGVVIAKPQFDNVWPYSVSRVVSSFMPAWGASDAQLLEAFIDAVQFAQRIIKNEIRLVTQEESVRPHIVATYEASEDKRMIVFDDATGWSRVFISMVLVEFPETLYFIRERPDGTWGIVAVQEEGFAIRKPMPEHWRGRQKEDMAEASGVADAIFCHKSGFLAAARSKEGALALAKLALEA